MEGCVGKDCPGFLGPEEEGVRSPLVIAQRDSGCRRIYRRAGIGKSRARRIWIIVEFDVVVVSADNQIKILSRIKSEIDRFLFVVRIFETVGGVD